MMSEFASESTYEEVAFTQNENFEVQENQSYASVKCTSVDYAKPLREKPPKEKNQSLCKHACLLPIVVIVLAAIVLVLSGCTVAAYVELSRLKLQLRILQLSPSNFSNFDDKKLGMVENRITLLENSVHSISEEHMTLETKIEQVQNDTHRLILNLDPAPSCADILSTFPTSPSGYYWIRSSNGSAVQVYCQMTRSCGNITGGWMRVAELDMMDTSAQCPNSLTIQTTPLRSCRIHSNTIQSCVSHQYSVNAARYSRICGRIIAYQFGAPDAFKSSIDTIDGAYVDGVSLTHGNPRQHIWTFAGASSEESSPLTICPCINTGDNSTKTPPAYVGNDYFCDTAAITENDGIFYINDPLWDGAGCGPLNSCCSFNDPPWFYKQLPQPTTDDIEMRVCRDQSLFVEDIAITIVEIYIQ